jgi:hypothetical protein
MKRRRGATVDSKKDMGRQGQTQRGANTKRGSDIVKFDITNTPFQILSN